MRIKAVFIVLFFMLMAALPIGLMAKSPSKNTAATEKTNEAEVILTANLCEMSFCDEAIKAVAIIQRTNSVLDKKSYGKPQNNSDKELLDRVGQIYNSNTEILIHKNKPVSVPLSSCSNGFTVKDKRYPFLEEVASPWDCFCKSYSESLSCAGVSINGINYLCQKGLSAEEALKWYLPKLSITSAES